MADNSWLEFKGNFTNDSIAQGSKMDPVTIGAIATVAGAALTPAPAGPSSADSVFSTNLAFDSSGWNVAFPGSTITSTSDKTASQGGAGGLSGNMTAYLPYAVLFVGALIAWKMLKTK